MRGTGLRGWKLGILILLLVFAAGCAKGTGHIVIHKDGSIDLQAEAAIGERVQALLGEGTLERLRQTLEERGLTLEQGTDGSSATYRISRHFASIEALREDLSWLDPDRDAILDVVSRDRWLFTTYEISGRLDLERQMSDAALLAGSLIPGPMVKLLLRQVDLDIRVTFPYKLYGDNNADRIDGNTLIWELPLSRPTPIELDVHVPNLRNIVIAAAGLIVVAVIAVPLLLRKRKRPSGRF
ncbi:hypothetical protein PA598K_05140 [Paenibacillus sp. 598K]|uniref:hypothetical protein n=1 Tax=Paenibacillus sp. 598K TaxID=1117987 RepID=UPI000FFAC293|nr:hypothetical protein [Paenibacillus sp. 598K]GBF76659.1 hypothetical protein PA598K_05140 [Paenibacillus sp. 598K]